jgi:hypothetical protein
VEPLLIEAELGPLFGPNVLSLLSFISKILERVILKRLNAFISVHNVLPKSQFGFRPAHSTFHQLNRVVRYIYVNNM